MQSVYSTTPVGPNDDNSIEGDDDHFGVDVDNDDVVDWDYDSDINDYWLDGDDDGVDVIEVEKKLGKEKNGG